MRWLACLLVVLVGCVATLPSDHSITADLACEAARTIVQLRQEIPPSPPKPSDGKCSRCNGTGRLPTDGRIVVSCNACGGTGKEPKSVCTNCEAKP